MLRILLALLVCSTATTVWSEEDVNHPCNEDSIFIEIYSRAVRQSFETITSSKKIAKNDIEMFTAKPNSIVKTLNNEFDTRIFSKACFASGKVYSFKYNDPSIIEFGIYQLAFSNEEDIEHILKILKDLKRNHFRTKKVPTMFTWHNGLKSVLFIFETILVGYEPLDHLKGKNIEEGK